MRKAAPLTGIFGSSGTFGYGHSWAQRHAAFGSSDETKSAVRMGRLSFVSSRSQRDADRRIEIQIKLQRTHGTEPEELRVRALPFERIKITAIKVIELSTTDPIDATIDDKTPLKCRRKSHSFYRVPRHAI
jgi:hypothetical protein